MLKNCSVFECLFFGSLGICNFPLPLHICWQFSLRVWKCQTQVIRQPCSPGCLQRRGWSRGLKRTRRHLFDTGRRQEGCKAVSHLKQELFSGLSPSLCAVFTEMEEEGKEIVNRQIYKAVKSISIRKMTRELITPISVS